MFVAQRKVAERTALLKRKAEGGASPPAARYAAVPPPAALYSAVPPSASPQGIWFLKAKGPMNATQSDFPDF
jgi:hypothetical protein